MQVCSMSWIPQKRRAQSWVEQIPVGWSFGQMWCPSEALLSESENDSQYSIQYSNIQFKNVRICYINRSCVIFKRCTYFGDRLSDSLWLVGRIGDISRRLARELGRGRL